MIGVESARQARAVFATVVATLDAEKGATELGRSLAREASELVALLYRAELDDAPALAERLADARAHAKKLLEALHRPEAAAQLAEVGAKIATALSILHPAQAELEKARTERPSRLPSSDRAASEDASDRDERRRAIRVQIDAEIGMQRGARFYAGRGGDVSTGGVFVLTPNALPIGTELTMRLFLPDGHSLVVRGVVRWRRAAPASSAGMGVRFVDPSERDARAIARFVETIE